MEILLEYSSWPGRIIASVFSASLLTPISEEDDLAPLLFAGLVSLLVFESYSLYTPEGPTALLIISPVSSSFFSMALLYLACML